MPKKYSRVQRYKALREQLEEETTAKQAQTKETKTEENTSLNHANQPVHPHQETKTPAAENDNDVMANVFEEARQYNLDNGNSVSDDTQINILKQLGGTDTMHRNQHFVPMEEDDDELGSTVDLSEGQPKAEPFIPNQSMNISAIKTPEVEDEEEEEEDEGPTILPVSDEPLPVHPVVDDEEVNETEEAAEKEEPKEDSKEKIVLSNDDIPTEFVYDDEYEEEELPEIDEAEQAREERRKEKERKKQEKRARKAKKKAAKSKDKMPSDTLKEAQKKTTSKEERTGKVLNIILIVLVVLLIIAIGFTVVILKNLGA
ncbi:MAG: hypothetical protein ACOX1W_09545 [Catenisphaera adipataccumulans]|jgi:hypothetical protein|uniref:hypothetical protein n=1 Tax=Catenisphaera adipataccumulans TaxID=700500 RepID=UPI003D8BE17C